MPPAYRCSACRKLQIGPPDQSGEPCGLCGGGELEPVARVSDKMLREHERAVPEPTPTQYRILGALITAFDGGGRPPTVHELAEGLEISVSTVRKALRELVNHGAIRRIEGGIEVVR